MNSEKLDRYFECGILALVLAILVYAPLAMGCVETQKFLVVQGLVVAVMFLWAIRVICTPSIKLLWPPLGWPVLAFALYAIARYFTADIEYVARQEMIQTLLYAFLFFAIVNNLTSRESANIIVLTLVFLAAGISCYALWQFMRHSNRVWNEYTTYIGRATGTYFSPNNFACFLEILLPPALAYLLVGRIKPFTRILLGYAILAMGAGLAVTFSRGGWAAGGAGALATLFILIFHRKHRLPALLLLIVLLGSGLVFLPKILSKTLIYVSRVESARATGLGDLKTRSELWQAAEKMWANHFWFGVGPAHYDYRFRQYRSGVIQGRPERAHNDYLNLLADWGTVGGIIVAWGIITFAVGLAKTWKVVWPDEHDFGRGVSNRFAFFLGASAALLALAAHSVVDFNLHIPANALIGVSFLALLTAQLPVSTGRCRFAARVPARILAVAVLAGGMAYFAFQGYWRWQESVWLAQADNENLALLDRAALLEKAFEAEPENFETAYQIAEFYRIQSFQGGEDYQSQAQTAMDWYLRAMKLNQFDGYNYLGYGMCLDWLGRHDETGPYYDRAEALDPNGYFTVANIGWHYVQVGDYPAARAWFDRSRRLNWDNNVIAHSYWDIVQDRLTRDASGQAPLLPGY
jgi:O-antigen ligase